MPFCGCRPAALPRCSWPASSSASALLASSISATAAPRPAVLCADGSLPATAPPRCPGQQHLPDGSLPQCRHPLRHGTPCHQLRRSAPASQHLCHCGALASNIFPMALRCSAPASNKPHLAEKSTSVWLAIWRTWAGFANSQHGMRPLPHLIIYVRILLCCHIGLLLRHSQVSRPICTDCLRHLRISAE